MHGQGITSENEGLCTGDFYGHDLEVVHTSCPSYPMEENPGTSPHLATIKTVKKNLIVWAGGRR